MSALKPTHSRSDSNLILSANTLLNHPAYCTKVAVDSLIKQINNRLSGVSNDRTSLSKGTLDKLNKLKDSLQLSMKRNKENEGRTITRAVIPGITTPSKQKVLSLVSKYDSISGKTSLVKPPFNAHFHPSGRHATTQLLD